MWSCSEARTPGTITARTGSDGTGAALAVAAARVRARRTRGR